MVTTFLQSLPLAQCLPDNSLVTVEAGCRVDAAIKTLQEHGILSCPVMRGGEYVGCFSVNDVLKALAGELKARNPHWLEAGVGALSADDLAALSSSLLSKTVGDLEHAGSLFLLSAQTNSSLLDFINHSFDIKDSHHVHHRVYVCMAPEAAHVTEAGATVVVNTASQGAASGKLKVTHVVSQLDVVRILAGNKGRLGGLAEQSLATLGLDVGAVFCVPASTPALEAFGRMAADEKSCLGLTDASGKLVGNLSASDLRSLHTPEAFASLLGSADFFCAAPASRQLGAVGADATLGELLDLLAQHSWHRAYVVNGEGRPASIVTLTDILRRVAA